MTDILKTTLAEADARLVSQQGDVPVVLADADTKARILVREWPFIDASVADSLITTMLATTYIVGPQVNGEVYEGLFAVSDVWAEENDERSVNVRQKLTRVDAVTTQADLPYPIIFGTDDTFRIFQIESGTGDTRTYVYLYLTAGSREPCLDPTVVVLSPPSGFTEVMRKFEVGDKGDRTGTLYVFYRKVTWPNTVAAATGPARNVQTGEEGTLSEKGLGYKKTKTYNGIDADANGQTALTGLVTADASDDSWRIEGIHMFERDNGEAVVVAQRQAINTAVTVDDYILHSVERNPATGTWTGITQYWPNLTSAAAATLLTTLLGTTSFSYNGSTYYLSGLRKEIDPATGLVTLYRSGKVASASVSWINQTGHEDRLYDQYFVVADDGQTYRVNIRRKVFDSQTDAVAWMNGTDGSTASTYLSIGVNNIKAHRTGRIRALSDTGNFEALKEHWTAVSNTAASQIFEVAAANP